MIFVLVGSSGSGKTTLGETFFGKSKELISTTSREKRPLEKNNLDYYFISKELFESKIEHNELLEYTTYNSNYYGLTKEEVSEKLKTNKHYYAVLDINGYLALKKEFDTQVVGIFIETPLETLKIRLEFRGEAEENIINRMSVFEKEQENKDLLDYVLHNNSSLTSSLSKLEKIVLESKKNRKISTI